MLAYLPIVSILVLLLTPFSMLAIRLLRPRFVYFWLVAVFGALVAWPLVLIYRPGLSLSFPLATWRPEALFSASPALLIDRLSGPMRWRWLRWRWQ
jgi:hypothetical protein